MPYYCLWIAQHCWPSIPFGSAFGGRVMRWRRRSGHCPKGIAEVLECCNQCYAFNTSANTSANSTAIRCERSRTPTLNWTQSEPNANSLGTQYWMHSKFNTNSTLCKWSWVELSWVALMSAKFTSLSTKSYGQQHSTSTAQPSYHKFIAFQ